jgi:hypothetical protein
MQEMVDARVPEGLTIRAGAFYLQQHESLHGHLVSFDQDKIDLQAYAGLAALSLFEVGGALPFQFDRATKTFRSGFSDTKDASAIGNLKLAGKVSLKLGAFSIAPYAVGTLPSGGHNVPDTSGLEVGGAVTAAIAKSMVAFHGNMSGEWLSSGNNWALKWRLGVSLVPLATKVLLLRPYLYLDGKETFAGNTGSQMSVDAGVQALVIDFVQVEAGARYRFLSNGGNGPDHDGPSNDTGTWSFEIGAGVAF